MNEPDPYDNRYQPNNEKRSNNNKNMQPFRLRHKSSSNYNKNNVSSATAERKENSNARNTTSHISIKKCIEILALEPDEILLKISDPFFGLDKYLDADQMGIELLKVFTELLVKGFKCNAMRFRISEIIIQLPNSKYFTKTLYESIEKKLKNEEYNIELIKNTMLLCNFILQINPGNKNLIEPILDKLEIIVKLRTHNAELIKQFRVLQEAFTKKLESNNEIVKTFKVKTSNLAEPPNKFIEISIVPSLNDIISDEESFLRENITNGAYRNVEHYLDVQFRLLREDFLQPLRTGVRKLRTIIDYEKQNSFEFVFS